MGLSIILIEEGQVGEKPWWIIMKMMVYDGTDDMYIIQYITIYYNIIW